MSIQPFTPEVAAERRRGFVRAAESYRAARSVGPRRASRFNLRVRAIRPADEGRLAELFDRLSPLSRLARFLYPKNQLTAAELRYFTDVDHHDHEALLATTRWRHEPVAVARFIRVPADPASADVAIAVADAWQNRRAGSMLAARLARRAQQEGIVHFTAVAAADNVRATRLLGQVGQVTVLSRDDGVVFYRVTLHGAVPTRTRRTPTSLAPAGA